MEFTDTRRLNLAFTAADAKVIWTHLVKERYAHANTTRKLYRLLGKLAVRDAANMPSQKMCILCREVPVGSNPDRYRKDCPHHLVTEIAAEHARLQVPLNVWQREFVTQMQQQETPTSAPQEVTAEAEV